MSGQPALPRPNPPFALVRERRFITAHAGGTLLHSSVASPLNLPRMDKQSLRREMAQRRRDQDPEDAITASLHIAHRFWKLGEVSRCRNIAAYIAVGGEVDCGFIIEQAWQRNKAVFLPVLHRGELLFSPCRPDSEFLRNRYGIPEPITPRKELFLPREMEVVAAPVVAFDPTGNRVGQGGGYYDRSFRFQRTRMHWRHPKLIGLAFDFQKTARLKASGWDIPLHRVVTERKIYSF